MIALERAVVVERTVGGSQADGVKPSWTEPCNSVRHPVHCASFIIFNISNAQYLADSILCFIVTGLKRPFKFGEEIQMQIEDVNCSLLVGHQAPWKHLQ